MQVLIIEDELKTARALAQLITAALPGATIAASLQSVTASVNYLSANPAPSLIFMDIQLADGLCFEIFKHVQVSSPVIFCTAFNDYALDAFKANGVDYVLKPFSADSITAAINKVQQLKNFFQQGNGPAPVERLLAELMPQTKTAFMVFKNNKYLSIAVTGIAYFYIRNETTTIVTYDGNEYALPQSLDEVYNQLPPRDFYRINRQYLVAFNAIKEAEHYFARKLNVILKMPTEGQLLIGKDKTTAFLQWMANR